MMITTYNEEGLTHTRRVRMYCGSLFIYMFTFAVNIHLVRWWHYVQGGGISQHNVALTTPPLQSTGPLFLLLNLSSCWRMKIPTAREMIRKGKKKIQFFWWYYITNLTVHKQGPKKVLGLMFVDVQSLRSLKWQKLCFKPGLLVYNWPSVQTMHGRIGQWQDHANFLWSMVALTAAERRVAGCFKQSHLDDGYASFDLHLSPQHFKTWQQHLLELVAWKFCCWTCANLVLMFCLIK